MVLISEVGDFKYITKVRWFLVILLTNYCPFILLLGPYFANFFSLFSSYLILLPSFSLKYFSGKEMVYKKIFKASALENQKIIQSAP